MYKLALKLMNKDGKGNLFYIITIVITTAFIFNMINILFIDGSGILDINERVIFTTPIYAVIFLIFFLIIYSNSYLSKLKSKEIAIEMISGVSIFKLGSALAFQTLLLTVIGYFIGVVIGLFIVPLFCFLAKASGIYLISKEAFVFSAFICILQVACIGIINIGYGYRTSISDLMRDRDGIGYIKDNKKRKELSILDFRFFIYTVLPVGFIFISLDRQKEIAGLMAIVILISIYGAISIVKIFMPKYIDKIKRKHLNNKIKLISLNNVKIKIVKNKVITYLIFSMSIGLIFSMQFLSGLDKFTLYSRITFMVTMILIAFMIIYRSFFEGIEESKVFKGLLLIGFRKDDINNIIKIELKYFYGIIIGIPLIVIIIFLVILMMKGIIDYIFLISYILIYFVIMGITTAISYIGNLKIMKSEFDMEGEL
ncbi:MAG: hypothetical protein RR894_07055 [Terrisporobacter sp.]